MPSHSESHNDEMQLIIGEIPPWIVRWGMFTTISVLIIFVVGSTLVTLPEIVTGKVLIIGEKDFMSTSWRPYEYPYYKMKVKQGQNIIKGDTILVSTYPVNGRNYVVSSKEGKVFSSFDTLDNSLKVRTIVVPSYNKYFVQLSLPIIHVDRVKNGAKVFLKLNSYPSEEFGILEGKVIEIGTIPIDGEYKCRVRLVNDFITNNHKEIKPSLFLAGTADVIVNEQTILQSLFQGVYQKFGGGPSVLK